MSISQAERKPLSVITSINVPSPFSSIDAFIASVGSVTSLVIHTAVFAAFFVAAIGGWVGWDQMLLVLTTILSLEAIYLAIFIQMSVNRQAASLKEVEADVETIHENVEGIKEDVGDIQQDVDELSDEITDDADEEHRKQRQMQQLEALTNDVKTMLKHIEALKLR
jgi:uncharacterized membrane protein